MKFSLKDYWQPTPPRVRKAADALALGLLTASASSTLSSHPDLAIVFMTLGIIVKAISNCFAD